jgi:transcriptional regulator with PAS, ATPase and Fis domain
MGKTLTGIEAAALERLLAHAWPGNLRELKQVIRVAVALAEEDTIALEHLILDEFEADGPVPAATTTAAAPAGTLAEAEKRHIEATLRALDNNKRQTAKALGVSRSTLDRKLTQFGLE